MSKANLFDVLGLKTLLAGRATGVGKGIAPGLASADATVAPINALGVKATAFKADFTSMDQAAALDMVRFAADILDGLDILTKTVGKGCREMRRDRL